MRIRYLCPLLKHGCNWDGNGNEILPHFEENHSNSLVYTNTIPIDSSKENEKLILMQYLNKIYLICIKTIINNLGSKHLTITLRLLGSCKEAAAHCYYVQVLCGTFSFSHTNSNLITSNNCSIEVDLHSISLITTLKNLQICILFENALKNKQLENEQLQNKQLENKQLDTKQLENKQLENKQFENKQLEIKQLENKQLENKQLENKQLKNKPQEDYDIFGENSCNNDSFTETRNETINNCHNNEEDDGLCEAIGVSISKIYDEGIGDNVFKDGNEETPIFQRRNSRKYSSKSISYRRRSSLIDLDEEGNVTYEQKHENERKSQLLSLKCLFCNLYATPPIFTCENNEVSCNLCRTSICRNCETMVRRNKILEDITKHVLYPCRFSSICGEYSLKSTELLHHEVTCAHAWYKCPCCDNYLGNFKNFHEHLMTKHNNYEIFMQLTNPFPPDTTFWIVNGKFGIFLCSSLRHSSFVDYNIRFCGNFNIYIDSTIVIMGKREHNFKLGRKNANLYSTTLSLPELKSKQLKAKNALLVITTTPIL